MNDSFTLPTAAAAQDLAVLLGRAARLDDAAAVRLIADSGVLAMYVAVITPKGLLDRGPTVLGLRTTALLDGSFDAVVPIASLQAGSRSCTACARRCGAARSRVTTTFPRVSRSQPRPSGSSARTPCSSSPPDRGFA